MPTKDPYPTIRAWLTYRARCLEHDGDYEQGALFRRVLAYIDTLRTPATTPTETPK